MMAVPFGKMTLPARYHLLGNMDFKAVKQAHQGNQDSNDHIRDGLVRKPDETHPGTAETEGSQAP